ncbi:MAG TPA: hypothetical protein GXX36_09090 [Clostridiaceae bacterium]|nr:hypothetical protein [Clostridiaceae bacterium]
MDNINGTQNEQFTAGKYNALLIVVGWICAVLSLVIYPFIFGLVGVVTGVLASKGGSKTGLYVIVTSIVLMGIGLIFGDVIRNYLRMYLGI